MRYLHAIGAELSKLRTLPAVRIAVVAVLASGVVLPVAMAANTIEYGAPSTVTDAFIAAVPFLQVGFILLGILPTSHEYAGPQVRTSFTSLPQRGALLAAKTVAAGLLLAAMALATTVIGATAAHLMLATNASPEFGDPKRLAGAAAYLALMGLLAHAITVVVRHLVPALVGTMGLVLIVSPFLSSLSEHTRWLPDKAAALLYAPGDAVLTPVTGLAVCLAWTAIVAALGTVRTLATDA